MTISEYIHELEHIRTVEGELEVHTDGPQGHRLAKPPRVRHITLKSPRERRDSFWNEWLGEEKRGCKVVEMW